MRQAQRSIKDQVDALQFLVGAAANDLARAEPLLAPWPALRDELRKRQAPGWRRLRTRLRRARRGVSLRPLWRERSSLLRFERFLPIQPRVLQARAVIALLWLQVHFFEIVAILVVLGVLAALAWAVANRDVVEDRLAHILADILGSLADL